LYADEAEKHYQRGMNYLTDSNYGKVGNLVNMAVIAFKCASFLGHQGAKIKLATCYTHGLGVGISNEKACYYLESARITLVDSEVGC
jgi:hypothetical protein